MSFTAATESHPAAYAYTIDSPFSFVCLRSKKGRNGRNSVVRFAKKYNMLADRI